ncbi:MAG: hypothetical protein R6T83_01510 [Salinibacter sp.]
MRSTTLIDANGHMVTVKAPDDQPANDPKEDDHHDFLTDHWMDVAAASFLGFKRHGIGTVVVTTRDPAAGAIHEAVGMHNLMYSPAAGGWLKQQAERLPSEWLDTRFQSYDPNEAAIVVMADQDGSFRAYAVNGSPTPPRAFELVNARQN